MCKHKSGGMSRSSGKQGDGESGSNGSHPSGHSASSDTNSYTHHRTEIRQKKPPQVACNPEAIPGRASRFPDMQVMERYHHPRDYISKDQSQHIKVSDVGLEGPSDNPRLFVCSLGQVPSWDVSAHPSSCDYEERITEESPMLLSHNPCLASSVVLTKPCDLPLLHFRMQNSQPQLVECRKLAQNAERLCSGSDSKSDRLNSSCDTSSVHKKACRISTDQRGSFSSVGPGCAVIFDTSQDLIELDEDSGDDYFEMPEIQSYASSAKAGREKPCPTVPCNSRTYSSLFSLAGSCQSSNANLANTHWEHFSTPSHSKQPTVFRIDIPSDSVGNQQQQESRSTRSAASNLPCPILSLTPSVDFTLNSDSDSSYDLEDSCMHFGEETSNTHDLDLVKTGVECNLQPKALPSLPSAAQLSLASSSGDPNAPMCKICHTATKEGDPLISPCRCSGTMQYIHCGCLMKWLEISSKRSRKPASCELCQYQYHWHKKFKVRHWQFPPCSRRDKILHLLFFLSVMIMVACATVTVMCFKQDKGMKVDPERTELTQSEIVTLVCGVLFFLAFFVAMYVEVKARNTIYKLLVKFVYINQQWYIDEYEKKDTGPVDV